MLLAREVPRPTAASARRSEYDSAAAVVGSDRALALNVERASSLASHGKACSRFVTHFNAFTRTAIVPNLVPCMPSAAMASRAARAGRRQPNSSNTAHRRSCAIRLAARLIRGTSPKGAKMFEASDMTSRCEAQSSRLVPSRTTRRLQWASRSGQISRTGSKTTNGVVQFQSVSSTSLLGMTWLVLSNETLQPKPLKSRTPVRENGTVYRNSASVGRWGVFMCVVEAN